MFDNDPYYSAAEAARMLGIEKGTLVTAIREGRVPAEKDARGRYILRLSAIKEFDERRSAHLREREMLRDWFLQTQPERPESVKPTHWEAFARYACNPAITFSGLERTLGGVRRQRWQQIIQNVSDQLGLIRPDGTRGVPLDTTVTRCYSTGQQQGAAGG